MSLRALFESYRERKSPQVARKILDTIRSDEYEGLMAELIRAEYPELVSAQAYFDKVVRPKLEAQIRAQVVEELNRGGRLKLRVVAVEEQDLAA